MTARSVTPASPAADLTQPARDDAVIDHPFRHVVGGAIWLAGSPRPDVANAIRAAACRSHDPEKHRKAAIKIIAYLDATGDLGVTFKKRAGLELVAFADADYESKEIDRRSILGVAKLLRGAAVSASSRTQPCVTLSSTAAECVALAEAAKEGLCAKRVLCLCSQKRGRTRSRSSKTTRGPKSWTKSP